MNSQNARVPRRILAGVFLIALATLLFEVSLTRILSVTLWYHFGFLVIALAMLGMTAAAVGCFVWREKLAGENADSYLGWFSLLFAIAAPCSIAVHLAAGLDRYSVTGEKFWLFAISQLTLLFVVFFASGMCISIALVRHAAQLNKVYFADLVGAGLGTLLLAPALWWVSGPAISFAVAAAGGLAGTLFFGWRFAKLPSCLATVTAAVALGLLCLNDACSLLKVSSIKSYNGQKLQEKEPQKVFEQWSAVGRVAVFPPRTNGHGHEMMRVTIDGGAPTNLHRFDGDLSGIQYLRNDFRQIAHHLKRNADVLVIGSAGGRDVRAALAFDQESITAVEINPVTANLVTQRYADYIGRIFQHPRVEFHNSEGRHFVATSERKYDLIQISMIDSWGGASSGAYVFNESGLYTKEAIADFMDHLNGDGILTITRYYQHDEALRLVNTMLAYLEELGVDDAPQRLAVVVERGTQERANVLLKNGRFTRAESEQLAAAAGQVGHAVLYVPHLVESQFLDTSEARVFRSVIHPASLAGGREKVVRQFPRDISAVTDDRPFFFFMDRPGDVLNLFSATHGSRRLAVPILYGVFAFLAMVSLLTVFLPLFFARKASIRGVPCKIRMVLYFACLGLGFMLVEMALMHRFTLLLGSPAQAFAIVVSTLLFSAGIGSWLSGKWTNSPPVLRGRVPACGWGGFLDSSRWHLCAAPLCVFGYVALGAWWWPAEALRTLDDPLRMAMIVALLAPLGILMGMCLPSGMSLARRLNEGLVAWGWGVNGVCSVFGCAAALVVALHFGLSTCLVSGAVCYLLAVAAICTVRPRVAETAQSTTAQFPLLDSFRRRRRAYREPQREPALVGQA